jgi:DegV family protein with EDD domain
MAKIAIITDSTAYLPDEYIQEHQIEVVPLTVNFRTESRREGIDIKLREFWDLLPTLKELPTTSQPSVGDFVQAYEKLLKNHDSIIGIFLSSGLSGTYNSAIAAASMVEGDITVIDSKLTSYAMEAMVREAVGMRDAGKSKDEIAARMQYIVENCKAYFVVDSLEHLHRGGRISGVAALVGSLLQVKPVLYVTDEGKLDVFEKVRTRRKALDRVLELFKEDKTANPGKPVHMAVVYTNNLEDAKDFEDRIRTEFPDTNPQLCELGPVIGTHVGPGILAIVYYIG